jgi:hypothetical protein
MKFLFSLLGLAWKIPGLGFAAKWANPVWGIALTVVQAVWWLIKTVIGGTFSFLTDTRETIAVCVWTCVGLFVGTYIGIQWDKHLVLHYKTQLATVQKASKTHDNADAAKARRAEAAERRAQAEERAKMAREAAAAQAPPSAALPPLVVTVPAVLPAGEPKRLRHAKRVRPAQPKPSVPSLQDDWNNTYGSVVGKW